MLELKAQVIQEINEQILSLTNAKTFYKSALEQSQKPEKDSKLKILSEMEPLEEGFLLIKKQH